MLLEECSSCRTAPESFDSPENSATWATSQFVPRSGRVYLRLGDSMSYSATSLYPQFTVPPPASYSMSVFLKRGYTDFFFDLSDVLLTWHSELTFPIDRKILRACLVSGTWFRYESGAITKEQCLARLSAQFSLEASVIEDAWKTVTQALRPNADLVALIKELKAAAPGKVRIFGASNVSALDYEYFRSRTDLDWSIFDTVFTSHELGIRLCDPGFFKRLGDRIQINYHDAVYVGHLHDADDVVNARWFGMPGIVLGDLQENRREMLNLVGDPVHRGREYLRANAGKHVSELDAKPGFTFTDNFTQLLVLEATGDR